VPGISDIINNLWTYFDQILNDPLIPYYILAGILFYLALAILKKLNFRNVILEINAWMANEQKSKGAVKLFAYLFIFALCVVGILIIFTMTFSVSVGKTQTAALNDYFSIEYEKTMKPQGEAEIARIVEEVRVIPNFTDKLEHIAEWETRNFTDIYWHHSTVKSLNPFANSYLYESSGKIRATRSFAQTPYAEDPYWITYHRFGACGEEAALFANVSNRSGIVSRPIVIDLGYWIKDIIPVQNGNHVFLEVLADDGEWYYFDPTIYGADHFLNESACKDNKPCDPRWFGKPEEYSYFASFQVLRVYRGDTKEDVSDRYTTMSENIVKSRRVFTDRIQVNTTEGAIPELFERCGYQQNQSPYCSEMISSLVESIQG